MSDCQIADIQNGAADQDLTCKSCGDLLVVAGDAGGNLRILGRVEPLPSSPERV